MNQVQSESVSLTAMRHSFAEHGAPDLRDFLDRLDHTSQHPGQHRTVIGHSYGAAVVAWPHKEQQGSTRTPW
ncbi:alpha/beta hydrolase [Mycolicibacterium sp.]|uniref:alpha/beta hydrolase n=1 Tax=Mycolicibacterium sp. TaxID=2320850 RepID=UPI0037C52702